MHGPDMSAGWVLTRREPGHRFFETTAVRPPRDDGSCMLRFNLRRRLRGLVLARGQMQRRALDRGLPGRRRDLGAEQVGDIEHVAGAFAEGRDMAEAILRLSFEIAVVS